ncbi:cytochrome P450 2K1-like [Onychostoma macrolepis]|uniref:cytochrome P450 2K1-like n=1 Tax=Onychostoma macrolepis TaxID=369639 RepID=UPI00272C18E1|nr:cytochrome P450 2K1-like [Onychostoma macrolepis]
MPTAAKLERRRRLTVVLESSLTMALVETLLMHVSTTGALLAAFLLFLVVYLFSISSSSPEDPPGPKPLPLLGNLHLLDLRQLHMSLLELSKKYGSVFTVHFGPKKVVVLAGYKTVKEALVNQAEEFGERDITPIFQDFNHGLGIAFANGDSWKAMRRFALSTLRDFGMGKKMSEEKIVDETRYLREVFEKFQGNPFDTTQPVNYAVSNIISAIVYGKRFDYEDPKFQDMVDKANKNIQMLGSVVIQIYNMCPILGPWMKTWRLLMENVESIRREIKELVNVLQETLNPLDSRGFIDSFLIHKANVQESGEKDSHFHEQNLLITVSNLFAAGTDTTGTTLRWGLMLMAKYPHIQDRVQEEIDQILAGREPGSEDRKNLPYTDAVIHEIQRLANIVPMNLPHMTSCDVSFNGYFIKKGTCVLPLLTSVLRDKNEWETPDTFNPEHFLDEKGHLRKRNAFMPFSAGRRVCLGESLARMELFLFFTSHLQHFRFTPPPGVSEDDLDLKPVVGLTLNPSPHKLCAISRAERQPN